MILIAKSTLSMSLIVDNRKKIKLILLINLIKQYNKMNIQTDKIINWFESNYHKAINHLDLNYDEDNDFDYIHRIQYNRLITENYKCFIYINITRSNYDASVIIGVNLVFKLTDYLHKIIVEFPFINFIDDLKQLKAVLNK